MMQASVALIIASEDVDLLDSISFKNPLENLNVIVLASEEEGSLTLIIPLLQELNSLLGSSGALKCHSLVSNLVLETLDVVIPDVLLDRGVLSAVKEVRVLLNHLFEPFPNLTFEIRLAP
jgi:hypothetical protein